MTRLIDADKLHTLFDEKCQRKCTSCPYWTNCKGHMYCELIDNAPTVDTDLSEYSKRLWKAAYERGKNERPQEWIPVSERLPEDLEPVNITWINHEPEPYYKEMKDKPFTATGVYFNGQWYWWSTLCTDTLAEYSHNYADIIDDAIEVVAWQPLPEPYKEADNDKV